MKDYTIICDDQKITFSLTRKKVKNVNLRVKADSTVVVSANKSVPYDFVEELVRDKATWIIKNLARVDEKKLLNMESKYITGEIISFLGDNYKLRVFQTDRREKVVLDGMNIAFFVKYSEDIERKQALLREWYNDQATIEFNKSLERTYPLVERFGIEKPTIKIRTMKTRWGSCSWKRGKITINTELIKKARECIDYVLLHELAHFKFHKHDAAFYGFLSALMPEWQVRRQLLKKETGAND
ncbi:MAG: M48 family metallopeptidase [Dethiobacteria bacterium]